MLTYIYIKLIIRICFNRTIQLLYIKSLSEDKIIISSYNGVVLKNNIPIK